MVLGTHTGPLMVVKRKQDFSFKGSMLFEVKAGFGVSPTQNPSK